MLRMALVRSVMVENHSSMKDITIGNSWLHEWGIIVRDLGDKFSSYHGVIPRILPELHPADVTINGSECSGNAKNQALAVIQGPKLAAKNTFDQY